ncbi:hypothetical protein [Gaetbulibacter aestuarii]|uniref:Outer membrane protein beta-barrel domain-containing protein n=1 Tax=Gaetbulibacter aestuarii TaxID=1502358 RepID=A0ABW7MV06_9FLAO
MSDKKHIDRLFQESFKDFEAQPDDAVWKRIEAKLDKKKKRRVIPIWWQYAGVAALLALLLSLGYSYFNTEELPEQNRIVNEEQNNMPQKSTESSQDGNNTITPQTSEDLLPENNLTEEQKIASENNAENKQMNTSDNQKTNRNEANTKRVNSQKAPANTSAIATNEKMKTSSEDSDYSANSVEEQKIQKDSKTILKNNTKAESSAVAINKQSETSEEADKNSALAINNTKDKNIQKQDAALVIAENNPKNKKSIEDAINDINTTREKEEDDGLNRWSIAANAAPVYFNSLGPGSAIDAQFNGNSKTGELNMSYGISASYALNKKLRVRSGVNKVSLGYKTNDVVVFQSAGINYTTSKLAFVSKPQPANFSGLGSADNTTFTSATTINSVRPESATSNAAIDQTFGYIEIPLELEYALLSKRFGIRVIGGFSTLFLSNNAVYTESEAGRTYLGEANNMNNTSYSGNFGLGFSYGVSKKLDLNIEPLLKYQFNSFNRTAGEFQPFFIGVYTGLSIKF